MKKFYLIAAAAAAVLVAGCAKNEVIQNQGPGDAVSFGVYVPKTVTKAGTAGTMTLNTEGTTKLTATGFGVFAQYSDGGDYNPTLNPNPNFMYNQLVEYDTDHWKYTPVKYWPNETIDDNHSATGPVAADKLSFFAYAPYVGTATGSTGITNMTTSNVNTDPKVTYTVAANPSEAVDLIWAVAPSAGFDYTDVHNTAVHVDAGMPLKNLTKPNTTTQIPFHFRHATARMGLRIVGAFDQVAAGGTLDGATKVTVQSVTLSFPAYTSGVLNLNNTTPNTPLWESTNGDGTPTTFTVQGADLNASIKDGANEPTPVVIPQTVEGVTASEKNLMSDDKYFFTLIPRASSTTVTITITYYVTTADAKLSGGGSRVQNVISHDLNFASGFAAGTSNNIKIILGLTSVKFVATVEDWADPVVTDVDLPINKDENTFDLPAAYTFTVDGSGNHAATAIYSNATGAVTLDSVKNGGVDVPSFASKFIFNAGNKTLELAGVAAGTYVLQFTAAGDATHTSTTKTLTLTVN